MTTNLQPALHDLAVKFSQEGGLRPVSMIEAAMTQAAAFAIGATTLRVATAIDEVVRMREAANRNTLMQTAEHWMSSIPLADVNRPAWVRAIQVDAILFAVDHGPSKALYQATQLNGKRDYLAVEPTDDKDRLFHELVVLVTGMRACLRDVIEDSDGQLVSRELARVEEADVLLKACEGHVPKVEQLKTWERLRQDEVMMLSLSPKIEFNRASGECICGQCGKRYFDHPPHEDFPWLRVVCGQHNVKL